MPEIHKPVSNLLVVEGIINIGNGPTQISISRASGFGSAIIVHESGADVKVQSENGNIYPLTETDSGKYILDQLPADPAQQYRLLIRTSNNKDYQSDLTEVKISPPIDSVNWKAGPEGVTIYVSTPDVLNKTIYYQWQFEETWKYHAAYLSVLEYKNGDITYRPESNQVYDCWRSDQSKEIAIASSARLNEDIIYQFPFAYISYNSTDKLIARYSILVKQTALTKEGYEWALKIKKNTEQLGTIFDAQPSGSGGNIHNLADPAEMIVGFIGASSQTVKRIYISRNELPGVSIFSGYENCNVDSIPRKPETIQRIFSQQFLPIQYVGTVILGATASCVDCREKGGTLIKPVFWK